MTRQALLLRDACHMEVWLSGVLSSQKYNGRDESDEATIAALIVKAQARIDRRHAAYLAERKKEQADEMSSELVTQIRETIGTALGQAWTDASFNGEATEEIDAALDWLETIQAHIASAQHWQPAADLQSRIIELEREAQQWEPVPFGTHKGSDPQMGEVTVRNGVVAQSIHGYATVVHLPEGWQIMRRKEATAKLEVKFLGSTFDGDSSETREQRDARDAYVAACQATTQELGRHWPNMEDMPDGEDVFSQHPKTGQSNHEAVRGILPHDPDGETSVERIRRLRGHEDGGTD